jgi:predicted ATPase
MAMSPAEQFAYQRRRFGAMRRLVAEHIAQAMLSGEHSRQSATWTLAADLEDAGLELGWLIRKNIEATGANYDVVWVKPPLTDPWAARTLDHLQAELARHIAGAYVSGSDDQVARARELETQLDALGINVDNRVDSLVLEQMRIPPSRRGTGGRADNVPF